MLNIRTAWQPRISDSGWRIGTIDFWGYEPCGIGIAGNKMPNIVASLKAECGFSVTIVVRSWSREHEFNHRFIEFRWNRTGEVEATWSTRRKGLKL